MKTKYSINQKVYVLDGEGDCINSLHIVTIDSIMIFQNSVEYTVISKGENEEWSGSINEKDIFSNINAAFNELKKRCKS